MLLIRAKYNRKTFNSRENFQSFRIFLPLSIRQEEMDGSKGHYSQCFLRTTRDLPDVCNYYLYNGEDVIRPEELLEQDAREI